MERRRQAQQEQAVPLMSAPSASLSEALGGGAEERWMTWWA